MTSVASDFNYYSINRNFAVIKKGFLVFTLLLFIPVNRNEDVSGRVLWLKFTECEVNLEPNSLVHLVKEHMDLFTFYQRIM